MKITEALEGYFLDKKLQFSKRTIGNYELFFRYFVQFTGDASLDSVTTKTVRLFLLYMKEERNYSARSVHDVWVALSSFWTWAEVELKTPHIIRGQIKRPEFKPKVTEPFTKEEINKLLKAAEFSTPWKTRTGKRAKTRRPTYKRDVAIILTLLDSGIRNTELRTLQVKDYDQENYRLYVSKGKGSKCRFVVVGNRTRKALWRYLVSRKGPKQNDPLFVTNTGKRIERRNLNHVLDRIADLAGVVDVYPHRFRHTFAITFLRNGGNVFVLQEILGHNTLKTVTIYARIAQVDIDAAIKHSVADNWNL